MTTESVAGGGPPRYAAAALLRVGGSLLERAGLPPDRAQAVAEVLLEGDLLGHSTHGFDLLPRYLKSLSEGGMTREGEPATVTDAGSALVWDGRYLPGPWLVRRAVAEASARLGRHPQVSVAIRRSHHIGALQAYLQPATDQGRLILLTCSDPSVGGVAPHGGVASVITPNPIAAGIPTAEGPIHFDVSMSTTTNAMTKRVHEAGGRLPGPWLVDREGRATDDPAVLFGDVPGAMLPLGGLDLGHKGFALALLVEALTSGLAGHGRADEPRAWGASVFLLLIDPGRFAGRAAFERQMGWVARACRAAPVAPGRAPVRLPGDAARARRARQLAEGVTLPPTTMPALEPWARELEIQLPHPVPTPR